jgi:hypothetical protein
MVGLYHGNYVLNLPFYSRAKGNAPTFRENIHVNVELRTERFCDFPGLHNQEECGK